MRNCNVCGAEVSDKARFCEMCGTKLIDTPATNDVPGDTVPDQQATQPTTGETAEPEVEELDLTTLDKKAKTEPESKPDTTAAAPEPQDPKPGTTKGADNVIDLKEILESDEKEELENSIMREVLSEDEAFFKICPMCGEEMAINKSLLENTPVMVKCLKCGNETKIW